MVDNVGKIFFYEKNTLNKPKIKEKRKFSAHTKSRTWIAVGRQESNLARRHGTAESSGQKIFFFLLFSAYSKCFFHKKYFFRHYRPLRI
jgi:hypothetical protein